MTFFDWNDELSLGIPNIDEQHHALILLVNTLYEAIQNGTATCTEYPPALVDRLKEYAAEHFRDEEERMLAAGSPDLPLHRAEHEAFRMAVAHFEDGCAAGTTTPMDMLEFLKTWLDEHIAGMDQRMAGFLAAAPG